MFGHCGSLGVGINPLLSRIYWSFRHKRDNSVRGLKICCPQGRAGSSPARGTNLFNAIDHFLEGGGPGRGPPMCNIGETGSGIFRPLGPMMFDYRSPFEAIEGTINSAILGVSVTQDHL